MNGTRCSPVGRCALAWGGLVRMASGLVGALVLLASSAYGQGGPAFLPTGSLIEGRYAHGAVRLNDGRVLVVGGWGGDSGFSLALTTAEVYSPASGTFAATGSMAQGRIAPAVALLPSGKVLVAGGYGPVPQGGYGALAGAEIYDPTTGLFSDAGSMSAARMDLTATRLANGQVLVVGGSTFFELLDTAEVFDETTGGFSALEARLTHPRSSHTATLLPGGDVLIAGGCQPFACPDTSAERFDATNQVFIATGGMSSGRSNAPGIALADGRVLAVGGAFDATGEVFDPATNTFSELWPMAEQRRELAAALVGSGRVLAAGGDGPLSSAELFDPAIGFTPTIDMHSRRAAFSATALEDGTVLVAGGAGSYPDPAFLTSAEIYHETGIVDLEPPTVHVPADITTGAFDASGAYVSFEATATDVIDGRPDVSCAPPSGSLFPVGTTQVTCTATDFAGNVSAPASFRVTVLGPLEISLAFTKGSVDTRTGVVTLAGNVSCSRAASVSLFGQVSQTISNRAIVSGSFFAGVACAAPTSSWTATVTPSNGRFKAGKAQATASGSACDFNCAFAQASGTVTLAGH